MSTKCLSTRPSMLALCLCSKSVFMLTERLSTRPCMLALCLCRMFWACLQIHQSMLALCLCSKSRYMSWACLLVHQRMLCIVLMQQKHVHVNGSVCRFARACLQCACEAEHVQRLVDSSCTALLALQLKQPQTKKTLQVICQGCNSDACTMPCTLD